MSKMFRLNSSDFIKGLIIAVLAPIVATVANALNIPGFDFATFDWSSLVSIGITAGLAYLSKNFLTDNSGKFGGVL